MSMLHSLTKLVARSAKRVGRGYGSGKGSHTVGRGNKGMRARKSGEAPLWFEGGQLPLTKRMPMQRGKGRFNVLKPVAAVSLTDINKMTAEEITLDTLRVERVIDGRFRKAKIIANGKIDRKVTIKGLPTSVSAAKMITEAGGTIS